MSTSPQDFSAQIIDRFITAHLAATVAGLPVYVHTIEHAEETVKTLILEFLEQLADEGFRVIVLITGHYGGGHVRVVKEVLSA